MQRIARPTAVSIALLLATAAHAQAVCEVPGQYPIIQAALDDQACRVINIAAGEYLENLR